MRVWELISLVAKLLFLCYCHFLRSVTVRFPLLPWRPLYLFLHWFFSFLCELITSTHIVGFGEVKYFVDESIVVGFGFFFLPAGPIVENFIDVAEGEGFEGLFGVEFGFEGAKVGDVVEDIVLNFEGDILVHERFDIIAIQQYVDENLVVEVFLNDVGPRLDGYLLDVVFGPHQEPGKEGGLEGVDFDEAGYGPDDFFDAALGSDPGGYAFDEGCLYFLVIVVGGAHPKFFFTFEIYHFIITLILLPTSPIKYIPFLPPLSTKFIPLLSQYNHYIYHPSSSSSYNTATLFIASPLILCLPSSLFLFFTLLLSFSYPRSYSSLSCSLLSIPFNTLYYISYLSFFLYFFLLNSYSVM